MNALGYPNNCMGIAEGSRWWSRRDQTFGCQVEGPRDGVKCLSLKDESLQSAWERGVSCVNAQ